MLKKPHTDNKAVFFVTCLIYLLLFSLFTGWRRSSFQQTSSAGTACCARTNRDCRLLSCQGNCKAPRGLAICFNSTVTRSLALKQPSILKQPNFVNAKFPKWKSGAGMHTSRHIDLISLSISKAVMCDILFSSSV